MREARSAALLRHPAIVTVHDVVEDGRPWIIMELLSGRSLEQEEPMPPRRAAHVGLEVLAALRAAHARGVLHRDVKPADIFLRHDGRTVLTDFGIASLDGDASLTRTGALIGSPAFMAPERARGEPGGPEPSRALPGIGGGRAGRSRRDHRGRSHGAGQGRVALAG